MIKTGPSDKSESIGLIGGPTGCYTAACAACWLGYDHSKNLHAKDIASHKAGADEFSMRPYFAEHPSHYTKHSRSCGCGYIPTGERGAAQAAS